MKMDYFGNPILWLSALVLILSLTVNIDVMNAAHSNPVKGMYGTLTMLIGIFGIAVNVSLYRLNTRIRALEEKINLAQGSTLDVTGKL